LTSHQVAAYFCGHEHALWDEVYPLRDDPRASYRQVMSGVAGGGYTYGVGLHEARDHCHESECVLPASQVRVPVHPRNHEAIDEISFVWVEVTGTTLVVQPYVLRGDDLVALERVEP
jgi:hypothetical protein